jgi:regulator of sirC expression with transglutaminase-like and TPR domain
MGEALAAFAAEVRQEAEIRLDRAALLIAAGEYPGLDIDAQIARLDEIAAGVGAPHGASQRTLAHAVRRRMYEELGFRGNRGEYYDPRNSYLNDVLDRRTGIPITLATVFIEVGRRVGLHAAGVGYPAHFLVKYRNGERTWIIDAFNGGDEFAADQFRAQIVRTGRADEAAVDYVLAGVTPRQILARMLLNLKAVYLQATDLDRALRVQEFTVALNPWSFPDIRDRGLLRAQAADTAGALTDFDTYLAHAANADDAPAITRMRAELEAGRLPGAD